MLRGVGGLLWDLVALKGGGGGLVGSDLCVLHCCFSRCCLLSVYGHALSG